MIHDENGKTGSGKKFYHNVISGADYAAQPNFVAIITPVIHCYEGGSEIDENSAVLGAGSKPAPGFNATGDVARGCARRLQPLGRKLSVSFLEARSKHSKSWCRRLPLIPRTPPNLRCWYRMLRVLVEEMIRTLMALKLLLRRQVQRMESMPPRPLPLQLQ